MSVKGDNSCDRDADREGEDVMDGFCCLQYGLGKRRAGQGRTDFAIATTTAVKSDGREVLEAAPLGSHRSIQRRCRSHRVKADSVRSKDQNTIYFVLDWKNLVREPVERCAQCLNHVYPMPMLTSSSSVRSR